MEHVIVLSEVVRSFVSGETRVPALNGIDLTMTAGEHVAIVGPSGSGKTTLLNLIGALDRPSEGTVTVLGHRLDQLTESQAATFRKNHIGFVFQDDALVPELTVAENVELPLVLTGCSASRRRELVRDILVRLGLEHRVRAFPPTLSGGEKQRASVARALIHRPALVLADEPTANLDTASAAVVMDLLLTESSRLGSTVVLTTHDPRVFDRFQRRIHLIDGRIERDDGGGT